MSFVLIEESGFGAGTTYKLIIGKSSIGRDSANNLQVLDDEVSRVHAEITVQDDNTILIKDLNSNNGTFVNGKKIKKEVICPGDKIQIGHAIFVIKEVNVQEESAEFKPLTISSDATHSSTKTQIPICPQCSQDIKADWKFCPHCGAKIS